MHGPGVPEAERPFIFDRFYRSEQARSKPGSGLGLAIVRQIAESHGGRVDVEEPRVAERASGSCSFGPSALASRRGSSPASSRPGRLRVDVAHATDLIHAAGTGITLTLAATPPEERDPRLSETMREAILTTLTVPASAEAPDGGPDAVPPAERVAVHAVALRALLTEAPSVLSPAERQLLNDWLDRLATARNQA
jgi:hypothetical protein